LKSTIATSDISPSDASHYVIIPTNIDYVHNRREQKKDPQTKPETPLLCEKQEPQDPWKRENVKEILSIYMYQED
jgi:hypothetical protein